MMKRKVTTTPTKPADLRGESFNELLHRLSEQQNADLVCDSPWFSNVLVSFDKHSLEHFVYTHNPPLALISHTSKG
jgi:hypothetical protein